MPAPLTALPHPFSGGGAAYRPVAVTTVPAGAGGEGEPTALAAVALSTATGLAVAVEASGVAPGTSGARHMVFSVGVVGCPSREGRGD